MFKILESSPTFIWCWVIGLSILGGLAAFIRKMKDNPKDTPVAILLLKLSGELTVAIFAGVLTFFLCQAWNLSSNYTAVFVAISGHLGGKAIDGISGIWLTFLKSQNGRGT